MSVYTYKERRLGNMWFLVVFFDGNMMKHRKVNQSQLFTAFDFGNYVGNVIAFTREAGIGDALQVNTCVIVRTR